MKTLRDIIDIPLDDLLIGIAGFADASKHYWIKWLRDLEEPEDLKCVCPETKKDDESHPEVEDDESEPEYQESDESNLPFDLARVVENNRAVVENFQATGAESLLKHLAGQLASMRKCNTEEVIDEVRESLKVSEELAELMGLGRTDRAEKLCQIFISELSEDNWKTILSNDKTERMEFLKKLDGDITKRAQNLVPSKEIVYAFRHMLGREADKRVKNGNR